jgi:hypothetical protein
MRENDLLASFNASQKLRQGRFSRGDGDDVPIASLASPAHAQLS